VDTGIPTLLYIGTMDQIPQVIRKVGTLLHREARAETPATLAEGLLTLPPSQSFRPKVLYARGTDGLNVTAPDTQVTEVAELSLVPLTLALIGAVAVGVAWQTTEHGSGSMSNTGVDG
jgi:hypothetical protein